LTEETFHQLVNLAYEAGAEAEHWPTFLAEYTEALGDRTASLSYQDLGKSAGAMALGFRTDPAWERSYAETYCALNPWTSRGAAQMQTGSVLVGHSVISDAELKRSAFYTGSRRQGYGASPSSWRSCAPSRRRCERRGLPNSTQSDFYPIG
jgi:hypothetical protein